MRPEGALIAERSAAQHCADLLRRGPDPADLLPQFARLGERLARALAPALATLYGGDAPGVFAHPTRDATEHELAGAIGPLAASMVLSSGVPGVSLLAALDGKAVLSLVDRAFGGKGDVPERLPETFALSADLLAQRIESLIARALGEALGHAEPEKVRVLRRDSRFAELAAFPAGMKLTAIDLELSDGARAPWRLTLALPLALLARLFAQGQAGAPPERPVGPADPAAAPFAAVPLPLTAVLVDMAVPLSILSQLQVGAVLPVSVARAVPLRIGDSVIARGTVGAQDDRVALRLTSIAS